MKLGLCGVADLVEFRKSGDGSKLHPYPIEYKRGKPKKDLTDSVQLCAQALCLEEMLQVPVNKGAFFYGETKRRSEVDFDEVLRQETKKLIYRLHQVTHTKKTPPAKYEKKCDSCSLINWCMPTCTNGSKDAKSYLNKIVKWSLEDEE